MKTDKLYYEVFQEFPDIFFRLIGKSQMLGPMNLRRSSSRRRP
ncbi:MAG: DUF2887 domain-containing protein [Hormoscilla sp. GM7CHS1pb]|nr:DUF2887 domain-containing protein [Hormoscilla sp. GM7CHS1pb]